MKSLVMVLVAGFLLGVAALAAFDGVMHATSTDEFLSLIHI